MPLYEFKAKNEQNKVFEGKNKFSSKEQLVEQLLKNGYTLIEAKEINFVTDISQISFLKKKVKAKDLAIFCRQFSIILEAGIPIANAIEVLREQTENPTLKVCISEIYENIQKGIPLSIAMKKHSIFPSILIYMVESGELSGLLDRSFSTMAVHFEKETKIQNTIKKAMTYPIAVLFIAIAVIFILMIKVVPSFSEILKSFGVELPIFTKILLGVSSFFQVFWPLILAGIFGLIVGGGYFRKSRQGRKFVGNLAIGLPVFKTVTKNILSARFSRTMATLMASGVLIIQALEVSRKIMGNIVIEEKMDSVIEDIKQGKGLSQPLSNIKYFPPMLLSMVRIGEESGNLDFSLNKAADFFDGEVETSIQQLMSLIEPVIVIVLSVVVAFVILSILYPMLSVYQSMSV